MTTDARRMAVEIVAEYEPILTRLVDRARPAEGPARPARFNGDRERVSADAPAALQREADR